MENQRKSLKGLLKKEGKYQLKVGEMCVEMSYSKNNKSLNECMLNILKQKVKEGWQFVVSTLHYIKKGGKYIGW